MILRSKDKEDRCMATTIRGLVQLNSLKLSKASRNKILNENRELAQNFFGLYLTYLFDFFKESNKAKSEIQIEGQFGA